MKNWEFEKMILWLLSCLIILISRTMNIITWKAYLRNSYYEYEFARNLAMHGKNRNIYSWFFICGENSFIARLGYCKARDSSIARSERSSNPHLCRICNTVVGATTNPLLALKTNLRDSCGGGGPSHLAINESWL